MKKLLLIACLGFIACNVNNPGREAAEARIQQQFDEIQAFIDSTSCTEESGCDYLPYGKKTCGGPDGYFVFSTNIDRARLEEMVADYDSARLDYNDTYGNPSDCSVLAPPSNIRCVDGHCVGVDSNL
ncbi:MAG: hypothetical protein WBV11_10640 [Salegentibacter sp.]